MLAQKSTPWSSPLTQWNSRASQRLERWKERGREQVLALLGPVKQEESPALPSLHGRDLARHHLVLALEALDEPGQTKPEKHATLRLLLNTLEQGGLPIAPSSAPAALGGKVEEVSQQFSPELLPRRKRLLSRGFGNLLNRQSESA